MIIYITTGTVVWPQGEAMPDNGPSASRSTSDACSLELNAQTPTLARCVKMTVEIASHAKIFGPKGTVITRK